MALVAGLLEHDVAVRDIAVVVRDLDSYEEPLARAARQHVVVPDFWTQLRVTQTRPFALVTAVCEALAGDVVDKHTLLQPLAYQWTPPASADGHWQISPKTIQRTKTALPEVSVTRAEWIDLVEDADEIDDRVCLYLQWLGNVPAADPETAATVLGEVIEAYADSGLPETKIGDSPALLETETDASAVRRVRKLVERLENKLADHFARPSVEQSWATVGELATVMATQRPGRRAHSHARGLDIFEANDIWGLDIPYVIAAGLTDSEWPATSDSTLQPEFEEQILRGSGDASTLAPNTSWTTAHDQDHFADTLRAASTGVIATHHRETTDGEPVHPSPFLSSIDTTHLSDTERQQLRSADRELPASIKTMLSSNPEAETDE
jgi:ATP-dependent helicase/nuclease subunit B